MCRQIRSVPILPAPQGGACREVLGYLLRARGKPIRFARRVLCDPRARECERFAARSEKRARALAVRLALASLGAADVRAWT